MATVENKLQKLEDVVKGVMVDKPYTRNDDFRLIAEVYYAILGNRAKKQFFYELLHSHDSTTPPFESITRCRRKLQAMYPELAADTDVRIKRVNETATYIEYALDI